MKNVFTFDQFLNEGVTGLEPVYQGGKFTGTICFDENEPYPADDPRSKNAWYNKASTKKKMKFDIKNSLASSIKTIQKYLNDKSMPLPKFIKFYANTSSTGTSQANRDVAKRRLDFMRDLFEEVLTGGGVDGFSLQPGAAFQVITTSENSYKPTKLDVTFYDPSKVKPVASERYSVFEIYPLTEKGLTNSQILALGGEAIDAGSAFFNNFLVDTVDEAGIVKALEKLKTYSDVVDLDNFLISSRKGSLQNYLNNKLFDDPKEMKQAVAAINKASNASGKGDIAIWNEGIISIIYKK